MYVRYSSIGAIEKAEELLKEMSRVGLQVDAQLVQTVEARKRRFVLFGDQILKRGGKAF